MVRALDVVRRGRDLRVLRCGDECPYFPGKTYLDWELADPAGAGIEAVRPIRDDIRRRVEALVARLDAGEAPV